jgi:hypothetical protein
MIYKLYIAGFGNTVNAATTINVEPCKSFLFVSENPDYQTFKKDLADGAELQDAEGNVIDGIAYLATLES